MNIWETFLALFRTTEEDDDEGGRFVPSPLDLSVRVGHGGSDGEAVRELEEIGERAREIEKQRDGDR